MNLSYEVTVFNISRMKNIYILRSTSVFAHISFSDQIKDESKNDLKNLYVCVCLDEIYNRFSRSLL